MQVIEFSKPPTVFIDARQLEAIISSRYADGCQCGGSIEIKNISAVDFTTECIECLTTATETYDALLDEGIIHIMAI